MDEFNPKACDHGATLVLTSNVFDTTGAHFFLVDYVMTFIRCEKKSFFATTHTGVEREFSLRDAKYFAVKL